MGDVPRAVHTVCVSAKQKEKDLIVSEKVGKYALKPAS